MNITEKIDKLRRGKGWSVARLARETNIPTVSLRVMMGREDPNNYNVVTLKKIADVLGVTVSYLTQDDTEKDKPRLSDIQRKELMDLFDEVVKDYFYCETVSANTENKEADNE